MTGSWQELRKCNSLSPKEADELFFPKAGGKSKKSKTYCEGVNGFGQCPVIKECLEQALKLRLEGFWAGTTDKEREQMKEFIGALPLTVLDYLPRSVREREQRGNVVQRRPPQPKPKVTVYDPLSEIEGPTDEEILKLETFL